MFADLAILLVLVHYIFDSTVQEDVLICKPLLGRTTGKKIVWNRKQTHGNTWTVLELIFPHSLWSSEVLLGINKDAVSLIQAIAPHMQHSHCCLHPHALAIKRMTNELKKVLNNLIKIVNFMKSRELTSRLFTLLCEELSSLHKTLLLHTEVRWLSPGKVSSRFYELKEEFFLSEQKREHVSNLNDDI